MNPKSQPLPRSAFAAFCALALAASMALPFVGASKSYAEEVDAPAAEDAQYEAKPASDEEAATEQQTAEGRAADQPAGKAAEYTVTFGTAESQSVAAGGTATVPTLGDREFTTTFQSVKTTAKFVGWYRVNPDYEPVGQFALTKDGGYIGFGFDAVDETDKIAVIEDYRLEEFKDSCVLYAGGESVAVNGTMELYALYTYETVLTTCGNYFMGINEANHYWPLHFPKGWTLGKDGIGDAWLNEYAHENHPDYVLKGYYYSKDGKPTDELFPIDTPINKDVEIWRVYVRNEPLSVSGAEGITASGTLSGPNVPVNAAVSVSATKASGEAYDALTGKLGSSIFGDVFEVTLLLNDGTEIHNGFGELTLSFPVGEENNGYNFTVYHRHSKDGSITSETAVAANGVVTITVTDLSSFALAKGEKAGVEGGTGDKGEVKPLGGSALAQTGDTAPVLAFGGFALAALGAVAFAGYRTRKSALK